MELSTLTDRAMQIRDQFAALEAKQSGRPWTNEQVMEGFVVDVGALMKLVMAKAGAREVDDLDQKLAHELSDCLWSVLVLAKVYGVDLEKAYAETMDSIEAALRAKRAAIG